MMKSSRETRRTKEVMLIFYHPVFGCWVLLYNNAMVEITLFTVYITIYMHSLVNYIVVKVLKLYGIVVSGLFTVTVS